MNLEELTTKLLKSAEEGRNSLRFVPWWEENNVSDLMAYYLFKEEEITEITNLVKETDVNAFSSPVGKKKYTLFHLLVHHNLFDAVKNLIDRKIEIDINNNESLITPLMVACCRRNFKMVELLINSGADVMKKDSHNRTCWHMVAKDVTGLDYYYSTVDKTYNQVKHIVKLLGNNHNEPNDDGVTPIIMILSSHANKVSAMMIDELLSRGIDTEYRTSEGDTVLTLALNNCNYTAALRLASIKELVNIKGSKGKTPVELSEQMEYSSLSLAFKENGAIGESKYENLKASELYQISYRVFGFFKEDIDKLQPALYFLKRLIKLIDEDDDDEVGYIANLMHNALKSDDSCSILDLIADAKFDFYQIYSSGGRIWCFRDKVFDLLFDIKPIKKLIELGVDINSAIINQETPINMLAKQSSRSRTNKEDLPFYEEATKLFSVDSMTLLDNRGVSAVHTAASHGHDKMLERMIEMGADINITQDAPAKAGNTPLMCACEMYCVECVKTLMNHGADDTIKNVDGETAAHLIVKKSSLGSSYNDRELVKKDRIEILKSLKNLDIPRNDGLTPLMLLQFDDFTFIEQAQHIFIEAGVDLNHKDNYGRTPLILAADQPYSKNIVKELVKAGADVNCVDQKGRTALHYCLLWGAQETARYLIKKGANYNHADNNGVTPATIAAEKGFDMVLQLMTNIQ